VVEERGRSNTLLKATAARNKRRMSEQRTVEGRCHTRYGKEAGEDHKGSRTTRWDGRWLGQHARVAEAARWIAVVLGWVEAVWGVWLVVPPSVSPMSRKTNASESRFRDLKGGEPRCVPDSMPHHQNTVLNLM
jgi:hypothetical protein